MLRNIAMLLLGLWLGAAIFFSGVVAPAAFGVLRAYQVPNFAEIAGSIVNRSLAVVNTSGFIIGVLVVLVVVLFKAQYGRTAFALQILALLVFTALTAAGQWIIAARMRAIRAALTMPLDRLPLTDPQRVAFDSLHRYSVTALGIAIIAALIGYLLLARTTRMN
jgi:hypothetical protein